MSNVNRETCNCFFLKLDDYRIKYVSIGAFS